MLSHDYLSGLKHTVAVSRMHVAHDLSLIVQKHAGHWENKVIDEIIRGLQFVQVHEEQPAALNSKILEFLDAALGKR